MRIHPDDALMLSTVRRRELLTAATRYRAGVRARRAARPSTAPCRPAGDAAADPVPAGGT